MTTKYEMHLNFAEGKYEIDSVACKQGKMKIRTVLVIFGAIKLSFLIVINHLFSYKN